MAEDAGQIAGVQVDWQHLPVAVIKIHLGNNNAINDTFVTEFNAALDQVLANDDVRAVVTVGSGKFYCYGIDLDYVSQLDEDGRREFATHRWHGLLTRLLLLPVPSVAAINGHAFGGGAVLTLFHDYRVMSATRGWWSTNEVHLGIHLHPRSIQLAKIKLSSETFHEALVMGRRYSADVARRAGIVDLTANDVLGEAIALANSLVSPRGYHRNTLVALKNNIYKPVLDAGYDTKPSTISKKSQL